MPIQTNPQNVADMLIEMQDAETAGYIDLSQLATCNPTYIHPLEKSATIFLQSLSDNDNWMQLAAAIGQCKLRGGKITITVT